MIRFLFILSFVLQTYTANADLQICPRMPVATAVSNQFLTSISASGATTLAQPAFTNLSGSIATSQVNSGTNASTTTFFRGDNTWAVPTSVYAPATVQKFLSGTSQTYNKDYTFVITSGSATVGATYTNNAITFTVYATVASSTQVVMSGSGAPAASGTLTKASGTGDSTLTFSAALAPLYLHVRGVGGGGGGGGNGGSGGTGGTGGTTSFGTSMFSATGGTGGAAGVGGNGGTASLGTGPVGVALSGMRGNGSVGIAAASGAAGGSSPFGGAGSGIFNSGSVAVGDPAKANTGSGGGGPSGGAALGPGPGGGAGGYFDGIITSPAATYTYSVGALGAGGTLGTSGAAGGDGAAGIIIVEEYYQ